MLNQRLFAEGPQEHSNSASDHEEWLAYGYASDASASNNSVSLLERGERKRNGPPAQEAPSRKPHSFMRYFGASGSAGYRTTETPQMSTDLTRRKAPRFASSTEGYQFYKDQYENTLSRFSSLDEERRKNQDQYLAVKASLDGEVARLRSEVARLHDEIADKNGCITELTDVNTQIRQAAARLQVNMSRKNVVFAVPPPDDDLIGQISTILNKIKTWSAAFASAGPVNPAALREEDLPHYRAIFPNITDLESLQKQFQDKKRRRLFVRGWAAYIMCNAVFPASPNKHHPGSKAPDCGVDESSAEGIVALENTMRTSDIPPGKANDWRALTFQVFSTMSESGKTSEWARPYIRAHCKRVTTVIQPWAKLKSGCEFPEVEAELVFIFEKAVQISHMLRQQRAYWTLRFPQVICTDASAPGGVLLFNKSTMVDDDDNEIQSPRVVEIVVTPAVFKQGTADGERFDIWTCLHQAIVVVQT